MGLDEEEEGDEEMEKASGNEEGGVGITTWLGTSYNNAKPV
jgi:hypothetical protein